MKKLLENESSEEKRRTLLTLYMFNALFFTLFLLVRTTEMRIFEIGFFFEFAFIVAVIRFYSRALKNKNYALWGLTGVISLYLLLRILHFTFINYNLLVLYIAFMTGVFLLGLSYFMSSPLYFPRIQWWEYDFRYRGELKATTTYAEKEIEVRLADLRRNCASILAFEKMQLGKEIKIEIPFGQNTYIVKGNLKTAREDIPGRPIRYGISLAFANETERKSHLELKKIWKLHKKANIRRKFSDFKEANESFGL